MPSASPCQHLRPRRLIGRGLSHFVSLRLIVVTGIAGIVAVRVRITAELQAWP